MVSDLVLPKLCLFQFNFLSPSWPVSLRRRLFCFWCGAWVIGVLLFTVQRLLCSVVSPVRLKRRWRYALINCHEAGIPHMPCGPDPKSIRRRVYSSYEIGRCKRILSHRWRPNMVKVVFDRLIWSIASRFLSRYPVGPDYPWPITIRPCATLGILKSLWVALQCNLFGLLGVQKMRLKRVLIPFG